MTPLKKYLLGSTAPIVYMPQIVIPIAGTVFVINTAAILITIGVSLVTSWALNALMPKPDFGDLTSRGILVNARSATAPQDFVYGQVRKGGTISYIETTDNLNDVVGFPNKDNQILHQIIVLAGHAVEEIGDIYINDEVVTLSADGYSYTDGFGDEFEGIGWVTTEKWMEAKDGGNAPRIRIFKHDGSQTSINNYFVGSTDKNLSNTLLTDSSNFGGAGQPAAASFVGKGLAYLYVQLVYDDQTQIWANGIPLITAVVKGKKVEDPRTSTTAYSNNAALCIRDYIKSSYGLNDSDIDDNYFGTAANICDENVNLDAGGTEDRYTINGIIRADSSHQDNLSRMVTACAGTLFWGAGKWKLVAGAYTAPTKTLTLDDLRGPITLDTRANLRDQFNGVQGTFNDASQRWITADYPPIESATFVTEDNGEERLLDLALPYTTSAATAQRIAKMTLFRGREQMTFSAEFGLNALDVEVGEIIELDIDRYGWSGKEFEVVGWRFAPDQDSGDLRIALTLRETSAAAFSWNAEESAIIGNNTSLPDFQAALTINNLTASGGGKTQSDGTFINSAILDWDDVSNAFVSYYEVEWKPTSDSTYSATTTVESGIELSPLIDGIEYTFRVRAVTNLGNKGPFATVTLTGGGDVTAPGLPTSITAQGGFEYITIRWTNPADADLNYVEVYENTSNTTSGATKVGISAGDEFVRTNLGLNVTRWYFLKAVDYSGNASAFTSGVSATTTFLDDNDFANGIYSLFTDQGLYAIRDVTSLPGSGAFTGEKVFNRTDGKLYQWDGSSWDLVVADVAAGSITETKIANDAITTPKIAADAVTANEIAAATITGNKIVANTITGGLLATSGIITNSAQINNAVVTNAKIDNLAVNTIKIADNAVTIHDSASFSYVSGLGPHSFDTNFTMPQPGTVSLVCTVVALGSAGSGDTLTIAVSITGRNTGASVDADAWILSNANAVGLYTVVLSGDVSQAFLTNNPLGLRVDVTVTFSGVSSPQAASNYVIMRRFK